MIDVVVLGGPKDGMRLSFPTLPSSIALPEEREPEVVGLDAGFRPLQVLTLPVEHFKTIGYIDDRFTTGVIDVFVALHPSLDRAALRRLYLW